MSALRIALPSKGRLKDKCLSLFERASHPIIEPDDSRTYQSSIETLPDVEVLFLSASEIARELAAGRLHAGVTGLDLAMESIPDAQDSLDMRLALGFGHADVVVAVPDAWVDVTTMADLDDVAAEFRQRTGRRLRVATKYWRLTQNHFRSHGIAAYRIVESLGATEGAPAAGSADAIVDITSTGSTLRANHLHIVDVILASQATLITARHAPWDGPSSAVLEELVSALKGVVAD